MRRHRILVLAILAVVACRQRPGEPAAEVKPTTPAAAQAEDDPRVKCPADAKQERDEGFGILGVRCADSNGLAHGPKRMWSLSTGQMLSDQQYVHGQLTGTRRAWYPSGQIQLEATCTDGMQDGRARYWDPDGRLAHEVFHDKGRRVGLWRWWDENGHVRKAKDYRKGFKGPLDDCTASPD